MSKVQQCHQTANKIIDPDDSPIAIRSMGTRDHGSIPNSNAIAEVPYSWHRLLH